MGALPRRPDRTLQNLTLDDFVAHIRAHYNMADTDLMRFVGDHIIQCQLSPERLWPHTLEEWMNALEQWRRYRTQ